MYYYPLSLSLFLYLALFAYFLHLDAESGEHEVKAQETDSTQCTIANFIRRARESVRERNENGMNVQFTTLTVCSRDNLECMQIGDTIATTAYTHTHTRTQST